MQCIIQSSNTRHCVKKINKVFYKYLRCSPKLLKVRTVLDSISLCSSGESCVVHMLQTLLLLRSPSVCLLETLTHAHARTHTHCGQHAHTRTHAHCGQHVIVPRALSSCSTHSSPGSTVRLIKQPADLSHLTVEPPEQHRQTTRSFREQNH